MDTILYLGVEGVLFHLTARSRSNYRRARIVPSVEPLPLLEPLSTIIERQTRLKIVLNSWLVADYGFRQLLRMLPACISQKAIGATIGGNRLHSRPVTHCARAVLLREDVEKRKPIHLAIVDASRSAIPTELLHRSILVNELDMQSPTQFTAIFNRLVNS